MKILKSIKWRLQLWYGLILVVVLAGFGGTAYQLEKGRQFRRIDGELHLRFGILADAFRRPPPRAPNNFNRLPPGQFPEGLAGETRQLPREFHLPPGAAGFFDTSNSNGYYFVITRAGNEIARSTNAPESDKFSTSYSNRNYVNRPPDLPRTDSSRKYDGGYTVDADYSKQRIAVGQPGPAWMHGTFREIMTDLPSGEWILVGKNVSPELRDLHHTALQLAMFGGLILLVGVVGGWWFVGRSLRPVSEISATAAKIAAGDLSQRINVAEAESELGRLAAVLNSTFARLETAFAQQKQFASDAAHELRTPVTVILTQTQTALNRERDAVSYKQTVEACQRAAQRMRKLIESLLELARFDAGQEILNRLPFDLAQTVTDPLELVQSLAEEFQVKMISEISTVEIVGDSGRLGQVVTNLLSNAIQYNQPGGEVRVQLVMQNGLAVLTVADTGRGIAAEDLPRVFERFYRVDASRTGGGNAGLGLSICKAIVEAHGGTIEVASEAGQGSTFTVRLPV